MPDREKVLKGLKYCSESIGKACPIECPYRVECLMQDDKLHMYSVMHDALELLKQPEDKELHLDDLDALVNMIAIKAKAEGRFFSPYEVGLALVAHGQHDERFQWGEVIKYSPCEVEQILNEVSQDGET